MKHKIFNQIIAQHQQRVYSLALYICRDQHEAEDITQEVFTRLWKLTNELPADKIKPWLLAVTRNTCIDKLRKSTLVLTTDHDNPLTKNHQEPAGHFQHKQLSTWLKKAISSLSEPYNSLIFMCDVQQHRHDVVAASLDLSHNQVKVYLHRARKQLKDILKEHSDD